MEHLKVGQSPVLKDLPSSSSVFCFRFFLDFEFFFIFISCCSKMNCVTVLQKKEELLFLSVGLSWLCY